MMNRDPLGIGKRIAQLEQSNVRVLGHQLSEERDMGRQLSAAPWTPHPRNMGRAGRMYLASPARTSRGRNLKTARRLPT